jgi:hypothetical protein
MFKSHEAFQTIVASFQLLHMGYFYSEQKESVETQKEQTLLEIKQLLKNDFIIDQVVDL